MSCMHALAVRLERCGECSVALLWQWGHAPYDLALVPGMDSELGKHGGVRPSLRRGPLARRPVVDIPVWFIEQLCTETQGF